MTERFENQSAFTKHPNPGSDAILLVPLRWRRPCGKPQDCGGPCILAEGHVGGCECAGDDPGCPGSCPA